MSQSCDVQGIRLEIPPSVWKPQEAALEMIAVMDLYQDQIKGKIVLDIGCGSGIFAIKAGLLGAAHVIALDLNAQAAHTTTYNWQLNDLNPTSLTVLCSSGFDHLPPHFQGCIDVIVSNPPAQPTRPSTPIPDPTAAHIWNEAGPDGRLVFDSIINDGRLWLVNSGMILTTTTSRHGHNKTQAMLNQLLAKKQIGMWHEILNREMSFQDFQKQYIDLWLQMDQDDGECRIYKRDAEWFHRFMILRIMKNGEAH